MAPMPLTGTIGATSSANPELQAVSNRKALPDSVTSFFLPSIERPEIVKERKKQATLLKQQKKKEQKSKRSSSSRQRDAEEQFESEEEKKEEDDDDLLNLEDSMILLQSLRQSRLTHLTSMLPYLSARHRTSTRYHPPPKDHPYPGGLDPSVLPPTLLNLGKADVRVGPFVFPRTRFSEARVEESTSDAQGLVPMKGQASVVSTPIKVKKQRKPKTPKVAAEGGATTNDSPASTKGAPAPARDSTDSTAPTTPIKPQPTNDSSMPSANAPSTSAAPMQSTPITKPDNQVSTSVSASPVIAQSSPASTETPQRPQVAQAPGAAPINEKVVKAVSAAAQQDPALQNLLYVAANNKASPDQLRELAAFIARVSAGLEKLEQAQAEERKKEEEKQAKIAAKKAARAADAKARRAAKKAASLAEAEKKAENNGAGVDGQEGEANNLVDDESFEASTTRFFPPPDANQLPSYPPIVVVEFRENPSARFILPLWRDAIVERRQDSSIRSIKVSMLLPGIGSSAALRASEEDSSLDLTKAKNVKSAGKKNAVPISEEQKGDDESLVSPANPPSDGQLRKIAPKGAETRMVTWSISGTSKEPLADPIWQIFGRVAGAKTYVDGEEVVEKENNGTTDQKSSEQQHLPSTRLSEDVLASVISKIRALPPSSRDDERIPKLKIRPNEIPKDLSDHLSDKFVPRIQVLASRPIVRIKRGPGIDGEEGEPQQFEVIRNIQIGGNAIAAKRARIKADEDEGGEDTTMGLDGGQDESLFSNGTGIFGETQTKPKRKRHVAKHNPDGTLKLCQACGTNSTPMWRRGPAGKSTLCNACGAKWKVGRLVVPDIPPTAPPSDEPKQKQKGDGQGKEVVDDKTTSTETAKDVNEGKTLADVSMEDVQQTNPDGQST